MAPSGASIQGPESSRRKRAPLDPAARRCDVKRRAVTPLDAAIAYAIRGPAVFPCQWRGPCRKQPLILNGFHDASTDHIVITVAWRGWPQAPIGVPTGCVSGLVVLDGGAKRADRNCFHTIVELGAGDCYVILIGTVNRSLAGSKWRDKIAERQR
jgi:Bifunctional DNA primase/polymerase, N-terminal